MFHKNNVSGKKRLLTHKKGHARDDTFVSEVTRSTAQQVLQQVLSTEAMELSHMVVRVSKLPAHLSASSNTLGPLSSACTPVVVLVPQR